MAWYNRTKTEKAAPDRTTADAPPPANVIYLNNGIGVAVIQWSAAIQMQQAMSHPIVGRALDKISASVQQMKWFAELDPDATPADRLGKENFIKNLNELLRSPNDELTSAQLRHWLALNYAGYGRAPFKTSFSIMHKGRPNGIYPMETAQISLLRNARGAIWRYKYGSGEDAQYFDSRAKWVADGAEDSKGFVTEIWKVGLKGHQDRNDNNTPLKSVGLPAQVITSLLTRAIQTAEGHPNVRYLVTCSKTLTAPQLDTLKQHLNDEHGVDGFESGKVPILQNAGDIEIHKLENDLSDIHSKAPSDDMARLIYGAFGIPIAIMGIGAADAAKFAGNYDGSTLSFWRDTLIPYYVGPIFQGMTKALCPPGVRISADLDSVPILMAARSAEMKELTTVDYLTRDEKRELMGWAPLTTAQKTELDSAAGKAGAAAPPTATTTGDDT